jgi:hypothetical protein
MRDAARVLQITLCDRVAKSCGGHWFFWVLGPKEMPKIVAETFQAAHPSNLVGTNNLIQPFQLQQASARSPTDRRLEQF